MMEPRVAAVHDELIRAGIVTPVALGGADERLFCDCDLASLAEHRLGDLTDPRELDAARRADWTERATSERAISLKARSEFERAYFLLDEGERVGTIALATGTLGSRRARMSSLYVMPQYRRRGVGRRVISSLTTALGGHGLGLRFDTSWCWPRTVSFYMKLGLWVYMWKRDLDFVWEPKTPTPHIEIGEDEASISVPLGDSSVVLGRARRRGEKLELDLPSEEWQDDKRIGGAYWHSISTLSLALALEGWPLIRSPEEWEESRGADAGAPEALAYKIMIWEAWDRHHGWIVDTKKIPGLEYPTWETLQARWDEEYKALGLKPSKA